jgi:hypothetical protein
LLQQPAPLSPEVELQTLRRRATAIGIKISSNQWIELVESSMVLALHDWDLYQATNVAPLFRLLRNQNPIEVRAKLSRA